MRPVLFLLLIIYFLPVTSAQFIAPKTVSSAGQSWKHESGISLDFTIGEFAIQSYSSENATISEGLHQPIFTLPTPAPEINTSSIKVYPNPVSTILEITSDIQHIITVEVRQLTGQVASKHQIFQGGKIDVFKLPPGSYFLTINVGNKNPLFFPMVKI